MSFAANRVLSSLLVLSPALITATPVLAQSSNPPPFIDMHVHSTNTTPDVVRGRMDRGNLRIVFLSALYSDLSAWTAG
ncbi:MAG: hypothetical protein ABIZ80_18805, partial [Bryobacteraceae bacterium]